ncbi:MAG: hypothetical protein GC134_02545 [Proteobacteria bacterium]|nr:hypothetical protein [Pseudomonadota bacterium]
MPVFVNRLLWVASRMSTAVILLAMLAVASLAGTFLEQGLPHAEYVNRYGDFWVAVFDLPGLFNVYAEPWFLGVGAVMAISVACCLFQNGPTVWRMLHKPASAPLAGVLKSWPVYRTCPQGAEADIVAALQGAGYRKSHVTGGWQLYRKGAVNRWGYFFTHVGVLVLCAAGLISGLGGWRGTTNLAEGEAYDATWLRQNGQMVNHKLPFALRNDGFGMDFYNTGMPSAFYTDLTLLEQGRAVKQARVAVNAPLFYKGYAVYQASFGDGGSELFFRVRTLRGSGGITEPLSARVRESIKNDATGTQIELVDFRANTVESVVENPDQRTPTFMDVGPSVDYILRVPDRAPMQLRAYANYPNMVGLGDGEGRYTPALLGLDPSADDGWTMLADLRQMYAEQTKDGKPADVLTLLKGVAEQHLSSKTEGERFALAARVLQTAQVLEQTELPAALVLDSYDQRLYTGLQIAYDPGADVFWIGGVLLVLGATLMTLCGFGRVWVGQQGGRLVVAGHSSRAVVVAALEAALPQTEKTDAA